MNRFLINLRSVDSPSSTNSEAQHFSRFSVAGFRVPDSILGNIGESLRHGTDAADENNLSNADGIDDLRGNGEHCQLCDLSGTGQDIGEPVAGPSQVGQDKAVVLEAVGVNLVAQNVA